MDSLVTLLLSSIVQTLTLLTEAMPHPDYFLVPAVSEVAATYVQCVSSGGRDVPRTGLRYFPQILDGKVALDALVSQGLLSGGRPVLSEAGWQKEFDVAWGEVEARFQQAYKSPAHVG